MRKEGVSRRDPELIADVSAIDEINEALLTPTITKAARRCGVTRAWREYPPRPQPRVGAPLVLYLACRSSQYFFSLYFFSLFSFQTFLSSGINSCDRCVNKVFECVNSFKGWLIRFCAFLFALFYCFFIYCFLVCEFYVRNNRVSGLLPSNFDVVDSFNTIASAGDCGHGVIKLTVHMSSKR